MSSEPSAMSPGKLWGLRRLADEQGRFKMLAVDQRPPIKNLVAEGRGTAEGSYEDVAHVKRTLVEELRAHSSAILLDPHYAYPTAIDAVPAHKGLLLTLENSVFEETPGGRRSTAIDDWSVNKIKRVGGDAVKVLAWYRPDADPEINEYQKAFVARIGDECRKHDIPFLFELLVYSFPADSEHTTGYVEQPGKRAEHVLESIETFAGPEYGVDVFKVESPLSAADLAEPDSGAAADEAQRLFNEVDRVSPVPWVMLSAGATQTAFRRVLTYAYRAGASGFLAGRAIWWDALQTFPDHEVTLESLRTQSAPYMADIGSMTDADALPFFSHRRFAPDGPTIAHRDGSFRHEYPEAAP
ncbi:MAG: tagatose 1,6-diphosphate aldolase [Acidimicrobiia bacterium]